MKLAKVHRIPTFTQSDWLKKYIAFNTDKRENAVNNLEKKFFKLMNNSVHGNRKFKKKSKVRLVNNAKGYKKYLREPSIVLQKIFSKNFAAIHEIKPVLTLDK